MYRNEQIQTSNSPLEYKELYAVIFEFFSIHCNSSTSNSFKLCHILKLKRLYLVDLFHEQESFGKEKAYDLYILQPKYGCPDDH